MRIGGGSGVRIGGDSVVRIGGSGSGVRISSSDTCF